MYDGCVARRAGRDVRAPRSRGGGALVVRVFLIAMAVSMPLIFDDLLRAEPVAATAGSRAPEASAAQSDYPLPRLPDPPADIPEPPPPVKPLELLSPSPVVRIAGRTTSGGAHIRVLSVRAPRGTNVVVRCRRVGCSRRSVTLGRGMRRVVRFRRFERPMRAGTIIEVLVSRTGVIGRFVRFRVRKNRGPARRDLCVNPGKTQGTTCPED